jgi:hypothetical protein
MPNILYHASNFPPRFGTQLVGTHSLPVTWSELVWAAVTVGKPGIAYLLTYGMHSISDIIVRSHTIYANLRQTHVHVKRSALYDSLDPTEKGAASYFLGMMAAKIICARLLDTPYVFHLSMLRTLGGTSVLHTNSQPDLIGLDRSGNWIVAEAKGRTNGFSQPAMDMAKLQTRRLRMINGSYPSLRVAIQAYFAPELNFAVSDPEDHEDGADDVDFDVRVALKDYYSYTLGVTQTASETRNILGREYRFRSIEEVGISIGIDTTMPQGIENVIQTGNSLKFNQVNEAGGDDGQGTVIFPDGLAVSLDQRWSEPRMRRDPRTRRGS